jgi:hypothetical protein
VAWIADSRTDQGAILGRGVIHHNPDLGVGRSDRSSVGVGEAAVDWVRDKCKPLSKLVDFVSKLVDGVVVDHGIDYPA